MTTGLPSCDLVNMSLQLTRKLPKPVTMTIRIASIRILPIDVLTYTPLPLVYLVSLIGLPSPVIGRFSLTQDPGPWTLTAHCAPCTVVSTPASRMRAPETPCSYP